MKKTADDRRVNFTERRVRELPIPATGRVLYHDTAGPLKVEVTSKDARTFYLVMRVHGRPQRIRLGAWPGLTVEAARRLAQQRAADVAGGADPVADARERRRADRAAGHTFADALAAYLTDGRRKQRTNDEYERLVDQNLNDWKGRPIGELDKAAVRDAYGAIARRRSESVANATMRVARAVFNLAVSLDRLERNPCEALRGRWYESGERDTIIPAEKMRGWMLAVAAMSRGIVESRRVAGDYMLFVLLTGVRRNEAARLRWADVDSSDGTTPAAELFEHLVEDPAAVTPPPTITVAETKNRATLKLPVTPAVAAVLARRRRERRRSPWVFPSRHQRASASGHVESVTGTLEAIEKEAEIAHSVHDLRRTFISNAAPIMPGPVLKALVNHRARKSGDVTQRHYVRLSPAQLAPHLDATHRAMLGELYPDPWRHVPSPEELARQQANAQATAVT